MSAPLASEPADTHSPIRVVVADDNSAIRTMARYVLADHRGFAVAEAADAEQAIATIESFHPDCLVLDLQMPDVRGMEALDRVRAEFPALPVIVVSGDSDPDVAAEAIRRGAASYLVKDGPLSGLADLVRRVTTGLEEEPPPLTPASVVPPGSDQPAAAAADPEFSDGAGEAARLADELKRLEYVVSHELGEPVRIMKGFAGLLQSRYADNLDARGQMFVRQIADASGRLQAMLDDLLTYSRAGRREPRVGVVDASAVGRSVVSSLRAAAEEASATVTVGDLPTVLADTDLLATVLRELVVNALTFTGPAAPAIRIEGRLEGSTAVITVTDNGPGIAPADRERVLGLFVRLHARDAYPGTGTGLALCRRLLAVQGGRIAIDEAPGGGTAVSVVVPAAPDEPDPQEMATKTAPEETDGSD